MSIICGPDGKIEKPITESDKIANSSVWIDLRGPVAMWPMFLFFALGPGGNMEMGQSTGARNMR